MQWRTLSSKGNCPVDGRTRPWVKELAEVVASMATTGQSLLIEALRKNGMSQEVLDKVIGIQFGSARSSFDGFEPAAYFVDGRVVRVNELGADYL